MYKMRNLSCTDKSYYISGKSSHAGCGILEWCWDRKDAEYHLSEMKKDPRFYSLSIGKLPQEDEDYQSSPEDFEKKEN